MLSATIVGVSNSSYTLIDPRPIAERSPYTFYLPGAAELAGVGAGDVVKLGFDYTHGTEKFGGERMWVIVNRVEPDSLFGTLDNQPSEPTTTLRPGGPVRFQRHHILSIHWSDPETAPAPVERREYWERCLVDACVLDGEQPVEFIYREEPDMGQDGDAYPDSGWRIRGRKGDATDDEMDSREMCYVAIGAVLNEDDSWVHLVDEPIGTILIRDFESDRYLPSRFA